MPGDLQALVQDIDAFVHGKQRPYNRQEEFAHVEARTVLLRGGSGNIPLLGAALLCALGHQGIRQFWRDFFVESRKAWMGRELMSVVYGFLHFTAVLLVYLYGPAEFKAEAKAWLNVFYTLLWLTSDSKGRTIFGGMRSAGHAPFFGVYCYILACADGQNPEKWNKGWKGKVEYSTLSKLKAQIKESAAEWRASANRGAFLRGWQPMVKVHLRKTKTGGSYWMPRNVNSNTPPWLAGRIDAKRGAEVLPAGGGNRIRQKFDDATCEQIGNVLHYHGELYPDGTMTLLDSEPIFETVWGSTVPDPPPPQDPEDQEPEPEDAGSPEPKPERKENHWTDWL